MCHFFINKNYKINLHIKNSQTSTKLKLEFATNLQTHPQQRKGESIDPPPATTQAQNQN